LLISNEIIDGIFITESKNRFLCSVLIENKVCECYVPSASKLKNYLNIKGKKIILLKNKDSIGRTQYSVFATMYYKKYIILNLAIVNRILEEYLKVTYDPSIVYREKYIGNYKTDFIVCGESTIIIEAKGIISPRRKVVFPTVYSKRAIDQLNNIVNLIEEGMEVQYFLISLSPIVREIKINNDSRFIEYVELLNKCISKGMILKGFSVYYENKEVKIGHNIKITP